MNQYNPHRHHRRSIRLQGYDYSQAGLYFITICCEDRAHLFGEVKNGIMYLNTFGKIALEEWYHTETVRDNVIIHESVVMPNHLHGIVEITHQKGENETGSFKSPSHTIGAIVRGYKIATIKRIKDSIEGSKEDSKGEDSKDEDSKGEYSKGEDSKGEDSKGEDSKGEDSKGEDSKGEYSKGEYSKGEYSKGEYSKGELQFAPTAPTAPIAPTREIIKSLEYKIWQRNYYEHIIRDEKAYINISNYIIENPVKWEVDQLNTL